MIGNIEFKYINPDARIKWAREYNDTLLLHVHGIGLSDKLEKINNYENDAQKVARDKFAISNKFITDRLLRPADNIFSAKGGSRNYIFETSDEENTKGLTKNLLDVVNGYSLSKYIEKIWFNKYITDPNGLIFVEVSEDGESIYPTYKSIKSIRNYSQKGIYVDWVIFEPDEVVLDKKNKDKVEKELFWAVDEAFYYRCEKKEDKIVIINKKENSFGFVPAILCSDLEDHVTGWKKSPIDAQLELLDKFMTDTSVLNIVDFMHCYPIPYRFVGKCVRCNGTGVVSDGERNRDGSINNSCPVCGGNGKDSRKDVTDTIEMTVPDDKEIPLINKPGGYIEAPTESWELKTKSVDRTWNIIMFSHWGTALDYGSNEGSQYATATGRFIDSQPVNNRLYCYTDSVQLVHNSISDIFGKFYFRETFILSEIIYGRRYLIETPDQLKKSYIDLVTISDNGVMADILYEQYLESEFRDNDIMLEYNIKLCALDPFPHIKLKDLKEAGVSLDEINRKLYVSEYKKVRSIDFVVGKTMEELIVDYKKYITDKKLPKIEIATQKTPVGSE